jgi:HSP20 family protein
MTLVKAKNRAGMFPSVFTDFFDTGRLFNTDWFEREFSWVPAVNIKENGTQFNFELAAPGFNKDDFKISLEDDVLTISAEKKEEKEEKEDKYTRREFTYNSFSRSFTLPQSANGEKVNAKYEEGILKLMLPKKEEAKTLPKKEIKVF